MEAPPASPTAAPQLGILDLDRSSLSHVFSLALSLHQAALRAAAGQEEALALRRRDPRRVLPLVSRAFAHAAADADPLWCRIQLNLLTLSAESTPRFVRWLGAHAPATRSLVLHGRALPTVAAALAEHAAALAAAVQRAVGLEQLELPRALAAPLLARLAPQQLPRLRAVGVDLAPDRSSSSGASSSSAASCRQRRRSREGGPGGSLSELERASLNLLSLPALEELHIQSAIEAQLLGGLPAIQSRLQRLHFADVRDVPRSCLVAPIARLAALRSLRLSQRDGFALPGPLTALGQLTSLHAACRYQDDPLLVSAQLSVLSSLRALWLQHPAFEQPAALPALPRLHTLGLVGSAGQYAAVLAALGSALTPLPLAALHLEAHASAVAEVPRDTWAALAALTSCPSLTRLELPYNRLGELPAGGYLAGLQVLDVSHNSLAGVPRALAACAQLSALRVDQQETASPGDAPTDRAVLAALPALRLLATSAGHYSASHMPAGLRSAAEAAHLERLSAALPPRVRVTNSPAEWERGVGRLQALFEVKLRG